MDAKINTSNFTKRLWNSVFFFFFKILILILLFMVFFFFLNTLYKANEIDLKKKKFEKTIQ